MTENLDVDRQLLYGILALQNHFIPQSELVSALREWVDDRSRPIGRILRDRGSVGEGAHPLLEALVDHQVRVAGEDPGRSLATLAPLGPSRAALESIADPDLLRSLARVASAHPTDPEDPYATRDTPVAPSTAGPSDPGGGPGPGDRAYPSGHRFRILRPHAKGGLGQVSVAMDEELNRQVALKEIQDHHADHPDHRSRFVREAEITGKLEHPGIIPVYGMGRYEDGRPFYAMRFIRGDTLAEAIARHHSAGGASATDRALGLRELLGRFLDVCDAMSYAHDRRVLHRDIKPGNILLGPFGETLVVDWGLAKPLDDSSGEGSTLGPVRPSPGGLDSTPTVAGIAHGTPAYMSPEQAEGRLGDLGPPSDVYSLGATLYQILAGRPPFSGRDVVDRVPLGDFPPPREVDETVPRPLEAICLRAMALRPVDRYPSTEALAADLKRWLADEPVLAYPEPASARARRWMKRHRTAMTAGAAAGLVALVALGTTVVVVSGNNRELKQANDDKQLALNHEVASRKRADEARVRAEAAEAQARESARTEKLAKKAAEEATARAQVEARTASRATQFLVDMLTASDPIALGGLAFRGPNETNRTLTARDILDRGSRKIATDLKDEPLVQARLQSAIGNVYRSMVQHGRSEPLLRDALATRRALLPPDDPAIAESLHDLGWWYHDQVRTAEALECYREALAIRRKRLGERHPLVAQTLMHIAWILTEEGDVAEAEPLLRRSIAIREAAPGAERDLAVARLALAGLLIDTDRYAQAVPLILSALQLRSTEQGMDDAIKAVMLFQQGVAFKGLKLLGPAEKALRESLEIAVRGLGDDHPYPAFILYTLAGTLDDRGRPAEADRYYRECLALTRRTLGLGFPRAYYLVHTYGEFLDKRDRHAETVRLHVELVEARRKRFPADHPMLADGLVLLAEVFYVDGRYKEAEPLLREALAIYAKHPDKQPIRLLRGVEYLAEILYKRGAYAEAEPLIRRALDLTGRLPAARFSDRADDWAFSLSRFGFVLVQLHRFPEAEASLVESIRMYQSEAKAANRWNVQFPLEGMAMLRRRQGRLAEAAALTPERLRHCSGKPLLVYEVALDLARCIPLAGPRVGPPSPGQADRIREYGDRAMEVLAEATRAGFRDAARLRKDRAAAPLRSRPDYRAFVEDLAFPDRPFAR